jgi:carboxylate-amine ligase
MGASGEFTVGVEEEYQIVDPASRELRSRAGRILRDAREAVGDEVTNELYLSQIEIGTPVCASLAEARSELARLRGALIAAAEGNGSRIASAGTHPFSRWQEQTLTPKDRYRGIAQDYQQIAREQVIFGCHVHVGFPDREAAIRAMSRARVWLAPLIALSASSPFWQGRDTGYASYRTELFQRFPTTGVPGVFANRAEYDALVSDLVGTGLIEDGSKIYWDLRPSSHYDTLEFRVADVCPTVDETVMIAGLCRALAAACEDDSRRGVPVPDVRPELLRAAKWYASRYGLDGELVDVPARRSAPAAEVVGQLLAYVRPPLERWGEWDEVSSLVARTLAQGNGARRQRQAFARAGRMEGVVDLIIAETASGLGGGGCPRE